jgi:hypothetical protein
MPAPDPEEIVELARELILKFGDTSGVKYLTVEEINRIFKLARRFQFKAEIERNR